ncbi:MAG TPA: hypothetical protein DDW52_00130 [Planctomycetaceae bacterium]|nr:hypothetical protein [Planctomycetaceae bacterium]
MRIWFSNIVDTQRRMLEVTGERVRIGRSEANDLVLHSPYIAAQAATLYRQDRGWEIVASGNNGLKVDGEHIAAGDHRLLQYSTEIEIFPYTLQLDLPTKADLTRERELALQDQAMSDVLAAIHRELLERMDLRRAISAEQQADQAFQLTLERHIETIAAGRRELKEDAGSLTDHFAAHAIRNELLRRTNRHPPEQKEASNQGQATSGPREHMNEAAQVWSRQVTAVPQREIELQKTAEYIENLLHSAPASSAPSPQIGTVLQRQFWTAWQKIAASLAMEFRQYLAIKVITKEIKDIVFGLGPLEDLLRLKSISEIMVVDKDRIYIERNGQIEESGRRFVSDEVVETIMQRIVGKVGRRIDKSQPLVDARLADGSRVNAIIPPLAVSGPSLTIRKFPDKKISIRDLVALGALPSSACDFLRAMVLARRNILVSGGTGSGKTTLLNCLSDFIPDSERIVTVEDTAELQLAKQHVVRLETKDANVEGAGEYTIRDLVRNALRMRPDRVVVGECRGAEALDMLQAMNTGHDGSLTTIHANSAFDVGLRLEVLVQMAADLPVESIRSQVASAVDIIIQLKRLADGRRIVSQITECAGINPSNGNLELRDIYLLDEISEQLEATGQLPTFTASLIDSGLLQLDSFYGPGPEQFADADSLSPVGEP